MEQMVDESQKTPRDNKAATAEPVEVKAADKPRYAVGQPAFFIEDNRVQSDPITGCMLMNYQYYYTTKTLTKPSELSLDNWTPQEKMFGTKEELISSL